MTLLYLILRCYVTGETQEVYACERHAEDICATQQYYAEGDASDCEFCNAVQSKGA